ncbi:MAG: hypothetical protein H6677_07555 [Candidatus Obscuribacterales bacterium]|nr:hypothetical protein [Candidatus Obscuribacterales bacterium]
MSQENDQNITAGEPTRLTYDQDAFLEQAASYRFALKKEKEIKAKRYASMQVLGAAAVNFVQLLDPSKGGDGEKPILTANLANDVINIRSDRRRLTITILSGVSSDRELSNARNENCGQIFVYAYLADQDTATLVSRLRVYINGDIDDGNNPSWNVDEGAEGCYPYLSHLINSCLFSPDMSWVTDSKLPAFLTHVPIVNGEVHLEHLHRTSGQYTVKPGK